MKLELPVLGIDRPLLIYGVQSRLSKFCANTVALKKKKQIKSDILIYCNGEFIMLDTNTHWLFAKSNL